MTTDDQEAKNRWAARHKQKQAERRAKKKRRHSSMAVPNHRVPLLGPADSARGQALHPTSFRDDLVVVSMPVWKIPKPSLARAVKSVLGQTHRNLRLVMISDGETTPSWEGLSEGLLTDPRLVRVRFKENMGPYFHHDVVLRGAPKGSYFAIQDADDESHKQRLEHQLSAVMATGSDACFSPVTNVAADGRRSVARPGLEVGASMGHRADHFGVFQSASLLALGGYHAGFRVGFDTVITSSVALLGRACTTTHALYTRYERDASLTRALSTGHGSRLRESEKEKLRAFWSEVYQAARTSRATGIDRHRTLCAERSRSASQRRELVATVRAQLVTSGEDRPPPASEAFLRNALQVAAAQDGPTVELARWLWRYCEDQRPSVLLCGGSQIVSFALAVYASRTPGVRLCILSHHPERHAGLQALMARGGIDVANAPRLALRVHPRKPRGYRWYDGDLGGLVGSQTVDLAVFAEDGQEGPEGVGPLWHAPQLFTAGSEIFLHGHDWGKSAVEQWRTEREIHPTYHQERDLWKVEVRR